MLELPDGVIKLRRIILTSVLLLVVHGVVFYLSVDGIFNWYFKEYLADPFDAQRADEIAQAVLKIQLPTWLAFLMTMWVVLHVVVYFGLRRENRWSSTVGSLAVVGVPVMAIWPTASVFTTAECPVWFKILELHYLLGMLLVVVWWFRTLWVHKQY